MDLLVNTPIPPNLENLTIDSAHSTSIGLIPSGATTSTQTISCRSSISNLASLYQCSRSTYEKFKVFYADCTCHFVSDVNSANGNNVFSTFCVPLARATNCPVTTATTTTTMTATSLTLRTANARRIVEVEGASMTAGRSR